MLSWRIETLGGGRLTDSLNRIFDHLSIKQNFSEKKLGRVSNKEIGGRGSLVPDVLYMYIPVALMAHGDPLSSNSAA